LSPNIGQRRNTTRVVKSSGRLTGIESSAVTTTGHDSGSGQNPVDWLVISETSPSEENVISPAESTRPPPAHATCSYRRGASKRMQSTLMTNVATREPSASRLDGHDAIQDERSSMERIGVPTGEQARAASRMSTGPTY